MKKLKPVYLVNDNEDCTVNLKYCISIIRGEIFLTPVSELREYTSDEDRYIEVITYDVYAGTMDECNRYISRSTIRESVNRGDVVEGEFKYGRTYYEWAK